jgi:sRNA-binding regulator protein Hfq
MRRSCLKIKPILLLVVIVAFIQCVPSPQFSPMQKRQVTTRLFECSFENAYRATLSILQDQGYIIKNTDMDSGLILASVDRNTSTASQIAQNLLVGYAWSKGTEIEVSCVVNKLSSMSSEIRINIQEVKYGESSWLSGTSKKSSKQIYEPSLYQNLFNQITLEIKRREAINGTNPESDMPKEGNVQKFKKDDKYNAIENQDIVVYLNNGDLIKGKVIAHSNIDITLRTSIGVLNIERKYISKIEEIMKRVLVLLNNGTVITGKLVTQDEKDITLETGLGVIKIAKQNIKKIEKQN